LICFVVNFLIAAMKDHTYNEVMHAGKTHDVFQTSGRKSPEARWRL